MPSKFYFCKIFENMFFFSLDSCHFVNEFFGHYFEILAFSLEILKNLKAIKTSFHQNKETN